MVTCTRGKEAAASKEVIDMFEQVWIGCMMIHDELTDVLSFSMLQKCILKHSMTTKTMM